MSKMILLVVATLLPLTAGCAQPAGMYQDAQVRFNRASVCFSVADTRETRRSAPEITGVTVSKRTDAGTIEVWGMNLARMVPSVHLSPQDCIIYGYQPVGGAKHSTYALRPGERYSIELNSFIPNPSSRGDKLLNRMYSRDFCLTKGPQDQLQIIIVPPD